MPPATKFLRRLIAGDAAVRLGRGKSCAWADSSDASLDGTGKRAQLGVTATRGGCGLARGPVGHLAALHLWCAKTANRSPAAGSQRGPSSCGTVPDIAWANRDRASLSIVQMSAEHRTIGRR